jgi:hypothetical protein
VSLQQLWRLDELLSASAIGYAKERMTGHGLRAVARTMLDEVLEYRVGLIERQQVSRRQ